MLILLMLWLPFSHNTIVEYHLYNNLRTTLSPGFDSIDDKDSIYELFENYMHDIFYPNAYEGSH